MQTEEKRRKAASLKPAKFSSDGLSTNSLTL